MKPSKIATIMFSAFFLPAILFPGAAHGSNIGIKLKLYGGLNYLSGGDLNEGLKGMTDYFDRYFWFFGLSRSGGKYNPAHLGMDFGGDVIIQITPAIGVGVGAGYLQGTNKSTLTYSPVAADVKETARISAVPLRLGLYFTLPAGAWLNVNFHAGLGYYLARMSYNLRRSILAQWDNFDVHAEANGLGFQGGLGFEFKLTPTISLFLEGQGRYADIGGFKGSLDVTSSFGTHSSESGKLYYYHWTEAPLGTFPVVIVVTSAPSGPSSSNVREAKIDFSGFSAVAGIIVRF